MTAAFYQLVNMLINVNQFSFIWYQLSLNIYLILWYSDLSSLSYVMTELEPSISARKHDKF